MTQSRMYFLLCLVVLHCLQSVCSENDHPKGHLLPLGHQHPPSVGIDEFDVDTAPTPAVFYEKYVKPSKAAIFRGAMKETVAFKVWTDEYIKQHYGDLEVRLEGKKEKGPEIPIGEKYLGRDSLNHFIDTYHAPGSFTYIVSELPKQMYKEAGVLPSVGACGEMADTFVEIDLWWSGGGSKSIIHKDAFNQINCLYRGVKHWKLFEYKYEKWLYRHWESEDELGGFSDINIDAVDLTQHPDFLKVPWSNFTIQAGDCLFLPKSYYHQVDSEGPMNLAVSILFSRLDEKSSIDTSDCTPDTNYKIPRPMDEFDIMWQWEGKGNMTMGFGDVEENFRVPLLQTALEAEREGVDFTVAHLSDVFGVGTSGDDVKVPTGDLEKGLSIIDTDGDGKMSSVEVRAATIDQLKDFGREIEPYEPSNTYEFEYSFVTYWVVIDILRRAIEEHKMLTREQWIDIYLTQCHGSKPFANEIFTGLAYSESINVVESKNITDQDLERALGNWKRHWAPQYSPVEQRPDVNMRINIDESLDEEFVDEMQSHEEL